MKPLSYAQLSEVSRAFKALRDSKEYQILVAMLTDEVSDLHVVTRQSIQKAVGSGQQFDVGNVASFYNGMEIGVLKAIEFVDTFIRLEEQKTQELVKEQEAKKKKEERMGSLLGKQPA